jgi:hypothetical protein
MQPTSLSRLAGIYPHRSCYAAVDLAGLVAGPVTQTSVLG